MTQPTLDGTPPGQTRIWPRYLDAGAISHPAWLRAHAEESWVGMCECGGYLRPEQPDDNGKRTDYRATCASCGKDICAPGGRLHRPQNATGRH